MPHNVHKKHLSLPFLKKEYELFIQAVEKWTGKKIKDEDLDRGIEIVNRDRKLMKQVYESRKRKNPPISGVESMYMVVASQFMDKTEHADIVEDLLRHELRDRTADIEEDAVRLMMIGSEDDAIEFVKMVESVGGIIVADDHCTGSRYFWDEVVPQEDRLAAIAGRYIDRVPCPTKDWPVRTRFDRIGYFAREFDVKGAIIALQKFCDPHEIDIPALNEYLRNMGVKTLELEFDVTVPVGPFRIRVEALLETIRGEDLF
jgi:benzoyl-CoA reductase subunit C